jgi:UDP-4-amino-4,6-dideoxy-N-acetyl-beta-L-altrosamine transaminase
MIPYGKQDITESDIDSVVDVLHSDFLTQGPCVPLFEKKLCKYTGANYAVAVNSATSALHIACLALGLGSKDILWTSPISFVASANCGLYCGATVDFVDVEAGTALMSIKKLRKKLEDAKISGRLPKIVIPVHFSGQSCDMKEISKLSREYGFSVIEDAAHAIGGKYRGDMVGNCKYSDITVFSFHPVKIITTGEGGAAMTNSKKYAEKMKKLRSHGITRNPKEMINKIDGPWYYEQIELGFNYRMTDIHAALGCSQIENIDKYVSYRQKIADRYDKAFSEIPITTPHISSNSYSSFHLYVIQLNSKGGNKKRLQLFNRLRKQGIGVNVHYIPIYHHPIYNNLGYSIHSFDESEKYYNSTITLPIYYNLTEHEQNKVINVVMNEFIGSDCAS